MKLFLHSLERLRIINEPLEWAGTVQEFQALEPAYPGLPDGATIRYQTPDLQYYEDSSGRHADPVDCLPYCEQVAAYLNGGCIYTHVSLSKTLLNIDDTTDQIDWEAHLKPSSDPTSADLPVSASWPIKLRHANGVDVDLIYITFFEGACAYTYRYREGLPMGDWMINEEDFGKIEVQGQSYTVRLAQPVQFALFRML